MSKLQIQALITTAVIVAAVVVSLLLVVSVEKPRAREREANDLSELQAVKAESGEAATRAAKA